MNCRVGRAEMSMKCDVTAGVLMWNWKLQWEMEVTGNHSEVGSIFFNSRVLFSLAVNAIFQQVLDFMHSGKPEQTLTNPIRRGRYLVDYSQSSTCTTLQLTEQTVWEKKKNKTAGFCRELEHISLSCRADQKLLSCVHPLLPSSCKAHLPSHINCFVPFQG